MQSKPAVKFKFFPSEIFILLLIIVFSFIVRSYRINAYDLWWDELQTDFLSASSLAKVSRLSGEPASVVMTEEIRKCPHSSLYYFVLNAYSRVAGEGMGLRWLSVFFSMVSLPVFYALSRRLVDRLTSICALLLLAFNPFHLWYAQEARAYAMAVFLALWMLLCLFQAIEKNTPGRWVLCGVVAALAVHANYFSILLFIIFGMWLVASALRVHIKGYLISAGIILLSLFAVWPVLTHQADFVMNDFWLRDPDLKKLTFSFKVFLLGYTATYTQYSIGFVLMLALMMAGSLALALENKKKVWLFLILVFAPVLLIYAVSILFVPIYLNRQLIIFTPLLYLLVARGITAIKDRLFSAAAALSIFILIGISVFNYHRGFMLADVKANDLFGGVHPKRNYHDLTAKIISDFRKGDIILAVDPYAYFILHHQLLRIVQLEDERGFFSSFYSLIIPNRLSPYDLRLLKIADVVQQMPAQQKNDVHFFKPMYDRRLALVPDGVDLRLRSKLWVLSVNWYKSEMLIGHPSFVLEEFKLDFDKVGSISHDGFFLDVLVPKAKEKPL